MTNPRRSPRWRLTNGWTVLDAMIMVMVGLTAMSTLPAQQPAAGRSSPGVAPRFLVPGFEAKDAPVAVDPARLAMMQRRISVALDGTSRSDALRAIARASALNLVYETQIVPAGTVRFRGDSVSVADALMAVLAGTDTDVLLAADGSVAVVRKAAQSIATSTPVAAIVALPVRTEIIRGRVTNDSGRALLGVAVIATMAPDRTVQQTRSDTTGHYELRFAGGTGDYLVYSAPLGYRPFRKRVTLPASDSTIVVDIRLTSEAALLEAVRVRAAAAPARPVIDGGVFRDPTALDYGTGTLGATVPPDLAGDLATIAATMPGMSLAADGSVQAFGLAGQSSVTLNGMAFPGGQLPRGARVTVSVTTAAYDPSIGGFGSARVGMVMAQGARVNEMNGELSGDSPLLQSKYGGGNQVVPRYSQLDGSVAASGPFAQQDHWYNGAIEVKGMSAPATSVLDAGPSSLALAGASFDSVSRLRTAASSLGLPLSGSAIPTARTTQSFLAIGRLDRFADPRRTGALWNNAFSLTTYLSGGSAASPGTGLLTAPTRGTHSANLIGQVTGQWLHTSGTVGSDLTSAISVARSSRAPYLNLPSASVLVTSALDGSDPTSSAVALGGSSASNSQQTTTWETIGRISGLPRPNHRVKLYGRVMLDHASSGFGADLGTFAYQSLADFAANRPAIFSRSLIAPATNAETEWRAAASIGDLWQLTPTFQLQPGVRLEGNRFLTSPELNTALDSALGVANNRLPNRVHLSPRLGFVWTPRRSAVVQLIGSSSIGTLYFPATGALTGGIGEFRTEMTAAQLLPLLSSTGLAGGTQLVCVDSAAPAPDWRGYVLDPSLVPRQCAGGQSVFRDAAPRARVFSPSYDFARSWRGNMRWASTLGMFHYYVDGVLSLNVDQPGTVDLNMTDTPKFTLDAEGGRPVYVAPGDIVPSTGVVAMAGARTSSSFGSVTELRSDLRSFSKQLTADVAPDFGIGHALFNVSYTLSGITARQRGFDAATSRSPFAIDGSRSSADIRHRVIVSAGRYLGGGIGGSLQLFVSSGTPYSPIVSSDINGDGRVNDLAYIFDPARAPDTTVATGLRSLLAGAPSRARECLERQVGRAAARNSCEGAWTASMNMSLSSRSRRILDGRNASFSLYLSNPLSGLDQLLHGNGRLHGWGGSSYVDPVLYTVTGFDPTINQFRYAVNPRFGNTRARETAYRAPFRLSLDGKLELGRTVEISQFRQFLDLTPTASPHAPAPVDTLMRRLSYQVGNYYSALTTTFRDSLLLSPAQVATLSAAGALYRTRTDSAWRVLAVFIDGMRDHPDMKAIRKRMADTRDAVWALEREEIPRMLDPLVPAQRKLATIILKELIQNKRLQSYAVVF